VRRRRHPLLKLIALLLVLCIIACAALYFVPVSVLNTHDGTAVSAYTLPKGCTNILLVGIDVNSTDTSRSDSMIIVSVGNNKVHLTSIMRDTGVYIPGRSGLHRINAAYAYGGIELLLQTINENFHLDITRYAVTNYDDFSKIIDALGGLTISDITEKEVTYLNDTIRSMCYYKYKKGQMTYDDAYAQYENNIVSGSGTLHLNGIQALHYARIRKLDSDYQRTARQRKVLKAAMIACLNPVSLIRMLGVLPSCINTNMSIPEIIALGERCLVAVATGNEPDQLRLPANGTYSDGGGMFKDVDYEANYNKFIDFVYGG